MNDLVYWCFVHFTITSPISIESWIRELLTRLPLSEYASRSKRKTFPTMMTIVLSEPDYLSALPKPPHVHCPAWQLWQRRGTRPEEEVSQAQEAWKEASVESEQLSALAASSWLKSLKRSDCQRSPCAATPSPSLPHIPSICKHSFFFNYAIAISGLPSPGIGLNVYKYQID